MYSKIKPTIPCIEHADLLLIHVLKVQRSFVETPSVVAEHSCGTRKSVHTNSQQLLTGFQRKIREPAASRVHVDVTEADPGFHEMGFICTFIKV